ncbi:MAG: Type restriction enzyme res subunit [Fibrobacteria bacterium]|jgi:type III restriction enzyme|nr:Type restriction enzyme res subunit [Fibrobacteria bacterium]
MIKLKKYQERVLESLSEFFKGCVRDGRPEGAFQSVLVENGWRTPLPYRPVETEGGLSAQTPYVCLRLPTGGGKTLLACHAAGVAMQDLLHTERSVVLWLVPNTTILKQTADALRDPRHPYRHALEQACGPVQVLAIEEALRLSRATVDGQTVVIVATIQAFRVEDTTGRKVYESSGSLPEHFLNIPSHRLEGLFPGPDRKPLPSLVNVLRLHRPVVIVDEAHNARTELSFSTLGSIRPACIIEFTATPRQDRNASNVLHYVSAAELKAADMIKLPVRVITRHPGQRDELLAEAVTLRSSLEKIAAAEGQATGEYIRPILLVQANSVSDCEPLRDRLVADFGFSKEAVKISVGNLDELGTIKDLSSPHCPVTAILTVQKLREGWDCPFAYVLCSLRDTRSAAAMEQITGRVLRLPGATAKQHSELNSAYVFSISASIGEVLAELREALIANGFSKAEAALNIRPGPDPLSLWLQAETVRVLPEDLDAGAIADHKALLADKVEMNPSGELTIHVPLDALAAEALESCVKSPEAKAMVREAVERIRDRDKAIGGTGEGLPLSSYERGLDFIIPRLSIQENGDLFEFESTYLLEHPWKLSQKDASLPLDYDPRRRPQGQLGEVDVGSKGELETVVANHPEAGFIAELQQQTMALSPEREWTLEGLISWLDRHIEHQDIPAGESAEFMRKTLRGLMTRLGIKDVDVLALDRFRLRDEIEERIKKHRDEERKAAFQMFMGLDSPLVVDARSAMNLRSLQYEPSWLYQGAFRFQKHYFGHKPGELADGTEEFACAQFIDGLPEIDYWVRNLVRKPSSFRLQTSKDWFYPDFLCRLKDGRILVIEYKGKHLFTDAEEKRIVGKVWESRSEGRCIFSMPTNKDFAEIQAILARSPG